MRKKAFGIAMLAFLIAGAGIVLCNRENTPQETRVARLTILGSEDHKDPEGPSVVLDSVEMTAGRFVGRLRVRSRHIIQIDYGEFARNSQFANAIVLKNDNASYTLRPRADITFQPAPPRKEDWLTVDPDSSGTLLVFVSRLGNGVEESRFYRDGQSQADAVGEVLLPPGEYKLEWLVCLPYRKTEMQEGSSKMVYKTYECTVRAKLLLEAGIETAIAPSNRREEDVNELRH